MEQPTRPKNRYNLVLYFYVFTASISFVVTSELNKKQKDEKVTALNGEIEPSKPLDQVKIEPYDLPPGMRWSYVDIQNANERKELYELLNENYVEDGDNMFRFNYSEELLGWALGAPHTPKTWYLGIRRSSELVGFISAVPACLRIYDKEVKLVEINFLCVLKTLRAKKIAPILIQEITRLVHLTDRWQATYTAGRLLPRPLGITRYCLHPL